MQMPTDINGNKGHVFPRTMALRDKNLECSISNKECPISKGKNYYRNYTCLFSPLRDFAALCGNMFN